METTEETEYIQLKEISEWLKGVRFKKAWIGGLDEQDVWKKIEELNQMYESALAAERVRYDTLLAEKCGGNKKHAAGYRRNHSSKTE